MDWPGIASPRPRLILARMAASWKCVVASTMALARRAGSDDLKIPDPTKVASAPSCMTRAASAGVAMPPAAKLGTGSFPFSANARARALGDTAGLVKFIADAKTDLILGVHIIGPMAGELIAEAVVAMEFRGAAQDIGMISHAHPSLSEAMKEAALGVDKRSLNI